MKISDLLLGGKKNSTPKRPGEAYIFDVGMCEDRLLLYNLSGGSWTDAEALLADISVASVEIPVSEVSPAADANDSPIEDEITASVSEESLDALAAQLTLEVSYPSASSEALPPSPITMADLSQVLRDEGDPVSLFGSLGEGIQFDDASGFVILKGGAEDDTATVSITESGLYTVLKSATGSMNKTYDLSDVKGVVFSGGAGKDTFANYTELNSFAFGGTGADKLVGGLGQDYLSGGSGRDELRGRQGDDVLYGNDGTDTLYGGFGDDLLFAGAGDDELYGEQGNDRIYGGDGNDKLSGSLGNDYLSGNAGNDLLIGDEGDDTLVGGDGDDDLSGGRGNDVLIGNSGSDYILGGDGDDLLLGGEDDDQLSGEQGDDTLNGQSGNDELHGGSGDDKLFGYDGDDLLYGQLGNDVIIGGRGNDYLSGSSGSDFLSGNDGNDKLLGGNDADILVGGSGDDELYGEAGIDALNGGKGNDVLYGGIGNDRLAGTSGQDELFGGSGDDLITGGDGIDRLLGLDGDDILIGGEGDDAIEGGSGDDLLFGNQGDDSLLGQSGDDILLGRDGEDDLDGGAGTDLLEGGIGNDNLSGGAGRDVLIGGRGVDLLSGSGGEDILIGGTTALDTNRDQLRKLAQMWAAGNDQLLAASSTASTENMGQVAPDTEVNLTVGGTESPMEDAPITLIAGTTVFDDGEGDVLTGARGFDWFFKTDADQVTDQDGTDKISLFPVDGFANAVSAIEHSALLNLVSYEDVTHTAVSDGDWSDPNTWAGGAVPADGARVLIAKGFAVTIDGVFNQRFETIRVDGDLRFATDTDTQLYVDAIVVTGSGSFTLGTEEQPVQQDVTARIVFTDNGEIDRVRDPLALGRGLVTMGEVSIYGAEVSSWTALATAPRQGDSQLLLSEIPTNWQVGDQLVLTGTSPWEDQDEVLTILAISGDRVTVSPLSYDHVPPQADLEIFIANISRNVVFESENSSVASRRGHVLMMNSDDVSVNYAGMYGLGRTDKSVPINDSVLDDNGQLVEGTGTNQRARYALHFHRAGVGESGTPAEVTGSVVVGSPGWGFVNHSSNVNFTDNVSFRAFGAGFVTEAGNEIGSFRNNIAIRSTGSGESVRSRADIQDYGHQGNGFWFQSAGTEVVGNVAIGQASSGFAIFTVGLEQSGLGLTTFLTKNLADDSWAEGTPNVAVGDVPFSIFSDNVAYASQTGLTTWYHLRSASHDARTVIDRLIVWNVGNSQGVTIPYSGQITLQNSQIIGNGSMRGFGIRTTGSTDDLVIDNTRVVGWNVGIKTPIRGKTIITGGFLQNTTNILVTNSLADNTVVIDSSVRLEAPSDLPSDQTYYAIALKTEYTTAHKSLETLTNSSTVTYAGQRIYAFDQDPDSVVFSSISRPGFVPQEYIGLTAQQLWNKYGFAIGGELAPDGAFKSAGVFGLVTEDLSGLKPSPINSTLSVDSLPTVDLTPAVDPIPDSTLSQVWSFPNSNERIDSLVGNQNFIQRGRDEGRWNKGFYASFLKYENPVFGGLTQADGTIDETAAENKYLELLDKFRENAPTTPVLSYFSFARTEDPGSAKDFPRPRAYVSDFPESELIRASWYTRDPGMIDHSQASARQRFAELVRSRAEDLQERFGIEGMYLDNLPHPTQGNTPFGYDELVDQLKRVRSELADLGMPFIVNLSQDSHEAFMLDSNARKDAWIEGTSGFSMESPLDTKTTITPEIALGFINGGRYYADRGFLLNFIANQGSENSSRILPVTSLEDSSTGIRVTTPTRNWLDQTLLPRVKIRNTDTVLDGNTYEVKVIDDFTFEITGAPKVGKVTLDSASEVIFTTSAQDFTAGLVMAMRSQDSSVFMQLDPNSAVQTYRSEWPETYGFYTGDPVVVSQVGGEAERITIPFGDKTLNLLPLAKDRVAYWS